MEKSVIKSIINHPPFFSRTRFPRSFRTPYIFKALKMSYVCQNLSLRPFKIACRFSRSRFKNCSRAEGDYLVSLSYAKTIVELK